MTIVYTLSPVDMLLGPAAILFTAHDDEAAVAVAVDFARRHVVFGLAHFTVDAREIGPYDHRAAAFRTLPPRRLFDSRRHAPVADAPWALVSRVDAGHDLGEACGGAPHHPAHGHGDC